MTDARSRIYDPKEIATFHCVSRCVRRAFLCGYDPHSQTSFNHRRRWIQDRLKLLSRTFAIDLISYAVMANHLHILIRNRPDISSNWSAEEVARRWIAIFPRRRNGQYSSEDDSDISVIAGSPELIARYRARLSNISWFMRCLSEPIARRANKEDDCTGRFWEGRFKCQRVTDLNGIIACSTYIDLNPIRAGIARAPEESNYTSVQDRIRTFRKLPNLETPTLLPIEELTAGSMTTTEYLELVDITGRTPVSGKACMPAETIELLRRLQIEPDNWRETTTYLRKRYPRAVGSAENMKNLALRIGQKWFHGVRAARLAFA